MRVAVESLHAERRAGNASAPADLEAARRKDFPAVAVGNVEGQTFIRVIVLDAVHPCACGRRGAESRRVVFERITGQLHAVLRSSATAAAGRDTAANPSLVRKRQARSSA